MKINKLILGKSRKVILALFDIVCFFIIAGLYYVASDILRPRLVYEATVYWGNSAILAGCMFFYRFIFGTYFSVWRYTNTATYFKTVLADALGGLTSVIIARCIGLYSGFWHFLTVASLTALTTLCSRFAYRLLYKRSNTVGKVGTPKINVAIVGAGQVGAMLADELICNPQSIYEPVFFIDRDASKIGSRVAGLRVYKEDKNVYDRLNDDSVREIFIAISNIDSEETERLLAFYRKSSCKIKIYGIPVKEHGRGRSEKKRSIREIQIEDLLFRNPINVNDNLTSDYYEGKTILVTGGGGSIGSELCRQIACCSPKRLIILDIYENNAYDIQQELIRKYGNDLDLSVEIASVRDRERLECIFAYYKPQIVFHAAAHKHVPLMEHSGREAIKNNILGTYNTADMAEKYGVEKFILISTDKAVNPTNIMGASKRMCEMVVQCRTDSNTSFAAVRFGNVLGSNGSVIPLFRRQIEAGGPVTITAKRIIRYFMTIPEASQLVMQAGAMAKRGELFVLDMGKPVKIYDLAVNLIRLSGYEPGRDIKIEEIGLRPGEKLYEELLIKTETLDRTDNNMIFIEKDTPLSREEVEHKIEYLKKAMDESINCIGSDIIRDAMMKVVPTFVSPESVNAKAEKSSEMKNA
jgi:FlaA1/EpsC-like NDP-sugar epimerase